MHNSLRNITAVLPTSVQQSLRRHKCALQIRGGTFGVRRPDWTFLEPYVRDGDWVIDVGANIGHYSKYFSDKVGPNGRVIAVEPVPQTFELLAANVTKFRHANVSLLALAASDRSGTASINVPNWDETRLSNYHRAGISEDATSGLNVLTLALDDLRLQHPISLIKIDTEGHDEAVLRGLARTLRRDTPQLVVETVTDGIGELLKSLDYSATPIPGTENTIFSARAEMAHAIA